MTLSAFDTRATATGAPLELRLNGETVVREIGSVTTNRENQTAVVHRGEVLRNTAKGKAYVYDYKCWFPECATVQQADSYLITPDRIRCRVDRIGEKEEGMRPVWMVRVDDVRTEAQGVRFLR